MQVIGPLECESSAFAAKVLSFSDILRACDCDDLISMAFKIDDGQIVNLELSFNFEILGHPGGRLGGETSTGSERCALVPFLNLGVRNYNLPIMVPIDRRIHMADGQ
jgi:hypothetical protein